MKRLIVVEDALFIREIYRLCLRDCAIEIIEECGSGAHAIELIHKLQPDLVLLDLVLADKNGFDVLSACADLNTRFLVISSLSEPEYKTKAKNLGAVAYLEKPFKKSDLINHVNTILSLNEGVVNG